MNKSVVLLAMVAIWGGPLAGCDNKKNATPRENFDRATLFANLGENVFLPAYQDSHDKAQLLAVAAAAYDTAMATSVSAPTEKLAAQNAWKEAMLAWQHVEMYQVGPAADPSVSPGGAGLRDMSYSWPTVNPCRVDQVLADKSYANEGFFDSALVNVTGLDALEYLLFSPNDKNACSEQVNINSTGSWDALGTPEIHRRRAAYAHTLADRLVVTTGALVSAWDPADGNFLAELKGAGNAGSVYETRDVALDDIFRALFYLELTVKDLKLAKPLGLDGTCSGDTCTLTLESRLSGLSKANIIENLRAFERAFVGGEPPAGAYGFDDALAAVGREDYATYIRKDTQAAIAAFEAIPGTLETALRTDRAAMEQAYNALKLVTDEVKGELATVLQLQIPAEGKGDAD